jgi:hypothetical protein
MENNEKQGYDEKTILISRFVGFALIGLGVYGLIYAFKTYKQ